MTRRRIACLLILAALGGLATYAFAVRATPLIATFLDNLSTTGAGVSGDGSQYINGVGGVQCYFGVNGKDVDLITYNSGRTLLFAFDANSSALKLSGLPANFDAEVDIFGINYYGPYRTMGVGTTAQVQMDLEFHYGTPPRTYELDYQSLAAKRTSQSTWLITSSPVDVGGDPGFTASDQAALNGIRRKTVTRFGAVNMPIRFEVTLK